MSDSAATARDETPNYYVIVPFSTMDAAEWAARHIRDSFDCHVISAAAVDPDAPLMASVTGGEDG